VSLGARGAFITFEGGEGAGKSTQLRLLGEALRRSGRPVVLTREPGGSPGAEAVRALLLGGAVERWDPVTETLLHYAARREHVATTIAPALARGDWVVSDRFADSTVVYQGSAQGTPRAMIEALHRLVLGDLTPDLTLLLDLPVAVGLARIAARGGATRYDRMTVAFHEAVRAGFLDLAGREPGRIAVIDASGSETATAAAVKDALRRRLGLDLPA